MRPNFDPNRLYQRLPYGTTVPSHCPDMLSLSMDCRVDAAWLEENLSNTPFVAASDRVIISASDYSNNQVVPFTDVMVIAAVEYKGERGGHPLIEFENMNRLVMGGREKWGYPKLCADIDFRHHGNDSLEVTVSMSGKEVIHLNWVPAKVDLAEQAPLQVTPHFLLRMLPSPSEPGMSFVEVLNRDTSSDCQVTKQRSGRGAVRVGAWPEHELDYCGLESMPILEVTSAKVSTIDWKATQQNGWARVIDRLI